MPSLSTLLLLLATLPGLLMPAGFGLARCECSGALRLASAGAPPACRADAAVGAAQERECCRRQPSGDVVGDAVGESVRGCDERGCECDEMVVSETPQKQVPPGAPFELPVAVLAIRPPSQVPVAPGTRLAGPLEARGPPAPGRERNLPLLL